MTEQKAIKLGIIIIAACTLLIPAIAGIALPDAVDDMGALFFTVTFAFVGASTGVLVAKIPKQYIKS